MSLTRSFKLFGKALNFPLMHGNWILVIDEQWPWPVFPTYVGLIPVAGMLVSEMA